MEPKTELVQNLSGADSATLRRLINEVQTFKQGASRIKKIQDIINKTNKTADNSEPLDPGLPENDQNSDQKVQIKSNHHSDNPSNPPKQSELFPVQQSTSEKEVLTSSQEKTKNVASEKMSKSDVNLPSSSFNKTTPNSSNAKDVNATSFLQKKFTLNPQGNQVQNSIQIKSDSENSEQDLELKDISPEQLSELIKNFNDQLSAWQSSVLEELRRSSQRAENETTEFMEQSDNEINSHNESDKNALFTNLRNEVDNLCSVLKEIDGINEEPLGIVNDMSTELRRMKAERRRPKKKRKLPNRPPNRSDSRKPTLTMILNRLQRKSDRERV